MAGGLQRGSDPPLGSRSRISASDRPERILGRVASGARPDGYCEVPTPARRRPVADFATVAARSLLWMSSFGRDVWFRCRGQPTVTPAGCEVGSIVLRSGADLSRFDHRFEGIVLDIERKGDSAAASG